MTTSTPPTRWPALFELVRAVYKLLQGGVSREAVQLGMDKMKAICGVLGLLMKEEGAIPAEVQALVDERAEARKNRDWKRSDELRDQIKALGYILEDTKAGQKVRQGRGLKPCAACWAGARQPRCWRWRWG